MGSKTCHLKVTPTREGEVCSKNSFRSIPANLLCEVKEINSPLWLLVPPSGERKEKVKVRYPARDLGCLLRGSGKFYGGRLGVKEDAACKTKENKICYVEKLRLNAVELGRRKHRGRKGEGWLGGSSLWGT